MVKLLTKPPQKVVIYFFIGKNYAIIFRNFLKTEDRLCKILAKIQFLIKIV